ncbi:MAG: hypothetical protein AAF449_07855, partial [Myxococcota bacterium]
TDPNFKLSLQWYFRLIPFKRQIQAIFDVSGYRGSSLPLRYMSDGVARVASPLEEQSQLLKMLLVMGLSDLSSNMFEVIQRLDPAVTAPLLLSLVTSKVVLDSSAWNAREAILGAVQVFGKAPLQDQHLGLVTAAWMQCSYAKRADRHRFKRALNAWLSAHLRQAGITSTTSIPRDRKERPRLVVIAEVMWDGHAMYRCYADRIRQLGARFETVMVGRSNDVDQAAQSLVHKVALFPEDLSQVDRMAQHVLSLEPDMVYYPSIGLAPWSVALANLRLAPIQLMSPGHPATAATDTIDYILLARNIVGDPNAYDERVIVCGDGFARQSSYGELLFPACQVEEDGSPVCIAIGAYSMKLSWPLIEALQTVAQRVTRPIAWHFFPNETGLMRQHVRTAVERQLGNAVVHSRMPYPEYIKTLGSCQMAVGTFPFAGSNSNVDLLRMGIPKVVCTGRQAMERSDVIALERFMGLDALMTESPEAFVDRIVELIENPDQRTALSRCILEQDPAKVLLETAEEGDPFAHAAWFAYTQHEDIMASECRLLEPEF